MKPLESAAFDWGFGWGVLLSMLFTAALLELGVSAWLALIGLGVISVIYIVRAIATLWKEAK